MKKMIILMAVLCLSVGTAVAQHSNSTIGIFADEAATICELDLLVYVAQSVYVYALINETTIPSGVTAVEFQFGNVPTSGPNVQVSVTWGSSLVIGDLWSEDFSIAWGEPVTGSMVLIGTLGFFTINADWAGSDYRLSILDAFEGAVIGKLIVDHEYNELDAYSSGFVFNCTAPETCNCDVATQAKSWGEVKALY